MLQQQQQQQHSVPASDFSDVRQSHEDVMAGGTEKSIWNAKAMRPTKKDLPRPKSEGGEEVARRGSSNSHVNQDSNPITASLFTGV